MEREKKYSRGLDNSRQHRRKMHFSAVLTSPWLQGKKGRGCAPEKADERVD